MSVVDEIKQRIDIVDLIGSYTPLQKAGRSYKGLCPFHTEKTPSFIVFPETGTWHCFGACSTGGDAFTFVMRQENMDFSEALRFLAERTGVLLTPLDDVELEARDEEDRLRAINTAAADYWHQILVSSPLGEPGRRYLERRGVTRETMDAFQLGYAPDAWHGLEEHLRHERMAQDDILTAGLIIEGERGLYDRFRSRVMFPIRDVRGHVIGFGGRVLDDGIPKYMNTPQTPLFDKSSVLYGIDLAREGIRQSDTAIIVEGYMDVIVPYQAGVRNLVACMGTALTEQHIDILKRMTHRLILALDPDAAGMHAVERGVATAQQTLPRRVVPVPTASGLIRYEAQLDAEIRVLVLPDGLDPDELILQDRDRWDRLVAEALPVAEYFFRLAVAQIDASTARGKRDAMERLMPVLAVMDNLAERTHYLQRLAQWIRVDERELAAELDRRRDAVEPATTTRRAAPRPQPEPEAPRSAEVGPAITDSGPLALEERCLALLLDSPPLLATMNTEAGLSAEDFSGINRVLYEALSAFMAGGAKEPELFAGRLDIVLRERVESLRQQLRADPPLSSEMILEDLTKSAIRLRKQRISRLIQELRFALQDAQGHPPLDDARQLNESIERLTRDYLQIDQSYYAATYVGRKNNRDKTLANHGP